MTYPLLTVDNVFNLYIQFGETSPEPLIYYMATHFWALVSRQESLSAFLISFRMDRLVNLLQCLSISRPSFLETDGINQDLDGEGGELSKLSSVHFEAFAALLESPYAADVTFTFPDEPPLYAQKGVLSKVISI
jgi:hypothetical protein